MELMCLDGHTLLFFGITVAVSWSYEHVGVETGLIDGAYHYTDALGLKLGLVPIIIPIAWFMMIYPSYILANLIGSGRQMIMREKNKNNNNNNRTPSTNSVAIIFECCYNDSMGFSS